MSYISKYVKNLKPSDLQVSFWGGDAVLRNLELRLDVLERELDYPLEIKSGRVRELVLHIPWNAILSKPVEAFVKDVEFVVKLKDVRRASAPSKAPSEPQPSPPAGGGGDVGTVRGAGEEQAPGYLQGYSSRILNNLTFTVQNLVVKVVEEECDMVMSFNVRSINFHIANENWEPSYVYTDYLQGDYSLHKILEVEEMAVHLQAIENQSLHKETPQEPFLRKCSFSCRFQSQYVNMKRKTSAVNILFGDVEFSADEKQFCLFLHLLDWILATYYNSKKLKGRDDQTRPADVAVKSPNTALEEGAQFDASTPISLEEQLLKSVSEMGSPTASVEAGGWGSWMWSFVETQEDKEGSEVDPHSDDSNAMQKHDLEHSSFRILVKSVTVNLRVVHQASVPVFYSLKSFSIPVLQVRFEGCMAKVDTVPSTQLFGVGVGIMAVQCAVLGVCPCAEKLPSTWKANVDTRQQVTSSSSSFSSVSFLCVKYTVHCVYTLYIIPYIF